LLPESRKPRKFARFQCIDTIDTLTILGSSFGEVVTMGARRIVIGLSLCLAIAGVAAAQPGQPAQTSAGPSAQGGRTLSAAEQVGQGEAILRRAMVTAKSVRTMLETARKEADIIRITCLDDKLTQVNANMRNVESRLDALRKAVDTDRRSHEHTVLTVLAAKLQVLDQEAQQCIGEGMYETGETTVVTEIDTKMLPFGETDPSVPPFVFPPSLPIVPPPASGTR
jgi:hypothetical protein